MKRFFQNVAGTIMMETVFTLPIYIVMLACLFWLGEICLGKLTLTHGERLRLWESGTRHISAANFINFSGSDGIFHSFPNSTTARDAMVTGISLSEQTFSSTETANNWGQISTGHMQVSVRRSMWSWGISDSFRRNLWNDEREYAFDIDGRNAWRMLARSRYNGTSQVPLDSSILSRRSYSWSASDTYHRKEDNSYNNSSGWARIANSNWGTIISPDAITTTTPINAIDSYFRNNSFEGWSR